MNISSSTVLLVVVMTMVANILVLLTVSARSRNRARHLVEVDGLISTSYMDPGPGNGWSQSEEGWPETAGLGWSPPKTAELAEAPSVEPPAYPEPTPLEQRSLDLPDQAEDSATSEVEVAMDATVTDAPKTPAGAALAAKLAALAEAEVMAELERRPEPEPVSESAEMATGLPNGRAPAGPRGRDGLTGLLDAFAFEDALEHEDAREQRYGRPATVIVFELDGLAKLSDRLGSDAGDRIEAALGDSIGRLARRADYVARVEAGRYAVLLPETDEVAAINYVERIRRACDLWLESGAIAMRLAIGWASTSGDAALAGAVRVATDRMRVELRRNARAVGDEEPTLETMMAAEGDAAAGDAAAGDAEAMMAAAGDAAAGDAAQADAAQADAAQPEAAEGLTGL